MAPLLVKDGAKPSTMKVKSPTRSILYTQIQELLINGKFQALCNFIDTSIAKHDVRVLADINSALSKPSMLRILISKILKNEDCFQITCSNSYCHENGFHKIVLLKGENFKLRLHHFGITGKAAMENIHDHRWPFASSILKGNLHMEFFELNNNSEDGELLLHHIYNSDKSSGSYEASLNGVARLKQIKKVIFSEGSTYLLLPQELHRIINNEQQESITLILTGMPVSESCNLYSRRTLTVAEKQTPNYSESTLRSHLQMILKYI